MPVRTILWGLALLLPLLLALFVAQRTAHARPGPPPAQGPTAEPTPALLDAELPETLETASFGLG